MPEYLVGKDYPHLCKTCKSEIDTAALIVHHLAQYAEDNEGPAMYVYDHSLYCGERGHNCGNRTDHDEPTGECACVLCGYISAISDEFHAHVHGVGNVCKGCRDEYPLACVRPGCPGSIYLSFVTVATGGTIGHFSCMNDGCNAITNAGFTPCDARYRDGTLVVPVATAAATA